MSYPYGFPLPNTWESEALRILPDMAANPPGGDYFLALVKPLESILDRYALLYAGLVNLNDASGYTLDVAGDLVAEPREGLSDDEYRRIIAGRRVAEGGRVSPQRAAAGWRALTQTTDGTVNTVGDYSIHMAARVSFTPSGAFIVRGGAIVRALVPVGYDSEAIIYRSDSAIYDGATYTYDIGHYAWSLRTGRT